MRYNPSRPWVIVTQIPDRGQHILGDRAYADRGTAEVYATHLRRQLAQSTHTVWRVGDV